MEEMEMEKTSTPEAKVGVYVCHCGGNISNTVDVEKVVAAAEEMQGVTVATRNMFMCSDPGQDLIINDLKEGKIDRVVVAACAPSLHELTFRSAILRTGMNPYLYVHANIREQVSFVHEGDDATNKAIAIVAAAVGKVIEVSPLEETSVSVHGHATVVGAGVAGLKSALDMAKKGLKVSIIEKSPFLGGQTALLDKLYPYGDRAGDIIAALTKEVIALGDKKETVTTEDLPYIISDVLKSASINEYIKVNNYSLSLTRGMKPTASLSIKINEKDYQASSAGDGQYDAFMKALWKIYDELKKPHPLLVDYWVTIPPGGKTDALVETVISWEYNDKLFKTRGLDADQTEAAIKATVKMLNLIENENINL